MMKRTLPRLAGITMIELLVVVAIIGVLIVALSRNLQSSLQRANDAQRKSDIKKISQALEQYYNDRGGYPAGLAAAAGEPTCGTTTTLTAYMKDVPCDPNGGTTRPYLYIPQGTSYAGSRGDDVHRGYRLLTALEYKADPQIAETCPTGCGGTFGSPSASVPAIYNFGLAANAQVNLN